MANNELTHYGVLGMKWGKRRYQNADGSLTPAGKKRYRKEYDAVKADQTLSERSKTANSVTPLIDSYNANYYNKKATDKLNLLLKKIGDEGVSQLDADVIAEGEKFANEAKNKAKAFNESLDLSIDDNNLWLKNPQEEYERTYARYINNNLVKR